MIIEMDRKLLSGFFAFVFLIGMSIGVYSSYTFFGIVNLDNSIPHPEVRQLPLSNETYSLSYFIYNATAVEWNAIEEVFVRFYCSYTMIFGEDTREWKMMFSSSYPNKTKMFGYEGYYYDLVSRISMRQYKRTSVHIYGLTPRNSSMRLFTVYLCTWDFLKSNKEENCWYQNYHIGIGGQMFLRMILRN